MDARTLVDHYRATPSEPGFVEPSRSEISPPAELARIGFMMSAHKNPVPVIHEAARIIWPDMSEHRIAEAVCEAADELQREAREALDQAAEALLRAGGDPNVLLRDVADDGPRDPEPGLRQTYPDEPPRP